MAHEPPHTADPNPGPPEEEHEGAPQADDRAVDYSARDILGSTSASVVLERLIDGDPLEIEARCKERISEEALMLALPRVHLRAIARIAYHAPRYSGTPALDDWIRVHIDEALEDLVDEDRDEELSGIPPSEPWDPRYAFMSEAIGVEPTLARRACIEFNLLPHEVRRTYFAIGVEGKTIRRYVVEGNGPPAKIRDHLKRALRALGQQISPELDEFEGGE
jgi:hypothetical protein